MNNLPTQIAIGDFKPYETTSGLLSLKHQTKEQQKKYREQCDKYYAAQEDMIVTTEPIIITSNVDYSRLNNLITGALFTPTITSEPIPHCIITPIYDDMENFSPVQDCKYPPSRLIASLINRL